jgi:hypothetical protein
VAIRLALWRENPSSAINRPFDSATAGRSNRLPHNGPELLEGRNFDQQLVELN